MGCGAAKSKNNHRKVAPVLQSHIDVHGQKQNISSPEAGQTCVEASDESFRIWVGTKCVKQHLPSPGAISELLYGDIGNSARGADVIVLFVTEMRLSKENVSKYQGLLRNCVDDSEKYIFNDTDAGLPIAGVPAQLAEITEDGESYIAMYVGVHRRFGGSDSIIKTDSYSNVGMVSSPSSRLTDIFPTPPTLGCGATSHGEKAFYRLSKSVMLQDVFLWPPSNLGDRRFEAKNGRGPWDLQMLNNIGSTQSPSNGGRVRPVHLLLCGANLSDDFGSQLHQLQQLMRHIDVRHRKMNPFSVLLFGHFNHQIVCGQDFQSHLQEVSIGKKGCSPTQSWVMKDSGVDELWRRISDPVSRRKLFLASSMHFTGVDCFGRCHDKPPFCSQVLTTLFDTNHDWVEKSGVEVPMLINRRTPVDVLWSQVLGFDVKISEAVTLERLIAGASALRVMQGSVEDLLELYFPATTPKNKTHSRVLKKNLGEALYMQVGWADGIGVYRQGSCKAELTSWDCQGDLMAFDHVPLKGSVSVLPSGKPPLRVWVGSVKLENRFPSQEALQHLLYGGTGASALGADVIALFFTDLEATPQTVKKLQNLLYNTLKESERQHYIFNEREEGLVLRAIPVQLLKADKETGKPRYVALYVCVRSELVGDDNSSLTVELEEAFPSPPELICRSDVKNEAAPSFKGHMAQTVVLKSCNSLHLVLVGLNFDTEDGARARQVERLERYLQSYHKQDRHFAAVIFGDFNNRLVCPHWLAQHVSWHGEGQVKGPVLKVEGARQLCSKLAVPAKRLQVMRELDSWFFEGVDAAGRAISVPTCFQRLRELFQLHFDLPLDEGTLPLPTYKRTPIGDIMSRQVGFPLEVSQLVTRAQLERGFQKLCEAMNQGCLQDVKAMYFQDGKAQRRMEVAGAPRDAEDPRRSPEVESLDGCDGSGDVDSQGPPTIDCGWPDSVGVYKLGVETRAEILAWGICDKVLGGFNRVPTRATVQVHRTST